MILNSIYFRLDLLVSELNNSSYLLIIVEHIPWKKLGIPEPNRLEHDYFECKTQDLNTCWSSMPGSNIDNNGKHMQWNSKIPSTQKTRAFTWCHIKISGKPSNSNAQNALNLRYITRQ